MSRKRPGNFAEGSAEEVFRLQNEAREARREADELRIRTEHEMTSARLSLLDEKQQVKDLQDQQTFLKSREASVREHLAELKSMLEKEQAARQEEATEARKQSQTTQEEVEEETSRLREVHREQQVDLQSLLSEATAARAAVESEFASLRSTAAETAQATHAATVAADERMGAVTAELRAAHRAIDELTDMKQLNCSLRQQLECKAHTEQEAEHMRQEVEKLQREVSRLQLGAADIEQLRKQLVTAEHAALDHEHLRKEYMHSQELEQQWRNLFASEVGATDWGSAEAAGRDGAMSLSADQVKARLQTFREQQVQSETRLGALQAELHGQQAATRTAQLALSKAKAEAESAGERTEALETDLRECDRRTGKLVAQCEGQQRLLVAMEEDREAGRQDGGALNESVEQTQLHGLRQRLSMSEEHTVKLEAEKRRVFEHLEESRKECRRLGQSASIAAAARDDCVDKLQSAEAERDAARSQLHDITAQPHATLPGAAAVTAGASGAGFKVMHMASNPAAQSTVDKLRAQVRALELQLAARSAGPNDASDDPSGAHLSVRKDEASEASNLRLRQELEELRQQRDSAEKLKARLTQVFKDKIKELRHTVQQLTGYRVDLHQENEYVLVSTYGKPGDTLVFRCTEQGAYQLVESEFAMRLSPQQTNYLSERNSIPGFLSAVTLKLLDA